MWLQAALAHPDSRESNFQAMVMPPISESLNRSRKVPSGLLISRSCACCLLTKPRMALEHREGGEGLAVRGKGGCAVPAVMGRRLSPVVPVRLKMLLQHLHDPVEPLPEGVIPPWQVFLGKEKRP